MTKESPRAAAVRRHRTILDEVLRPAARPAAVPLATSVHATAEHLAPRTAASRPHAPCAIGHRWGPVWSSAWFRLQGERPASWDPAHVRVAFSSGTEALLWDGDLPWHGLGPHHREAPLPPSARATPTVELLVEAACTVPLGATFFWWDERELAQRFAEAHPGRLELAELRLVDPDADALALAAQAAIERLEQMRDDDPAWRPLEAALERVAALEALPPGERAAAAAALRADLAAAVRAATPRATRAHLVGHAHIDTGWLWPLPETVRKCLRSWATAQRLIEADDRFVFAATQPQQYDWAFARVPALRERLAALVRAGRWECAGAMWVEPDCSIPAGESLVRQLVHGLDWIERAFGPAALPRTLFLPDTFGFPASLPQIARGAGLEAFITSKLAWSEVNEFPCTTFHWRGLDGTTILAHALPGEEYNAEGSARDLDRGERNVARKGPTGVASWLQPIGWGDGGGGPTETMVRRAALLEDRNEDRNAGAGGPRRSSVHGFLDALQAEAAAAGDAVPTWDGELYLEMHRGTLTASAHVKHACRALEGALRRAEIALAAAGRPAPAALGDAWRTLLLAHFHDVATGTCTAEVRTGVLERLGHARAAADAEASTALDAGDGATIVVANDASTPRRGVVETPQGLRYVAAAPALAAVALGDDAAPHPVRTTPRTLDNGIVAVAIDDGGAIVSLRAFGVDGDLAPRGAALDRLVLHPDLPRRWEAWDVDAEHRARAIPLPPPTAIRVALADPLRGVLEIERELPGCGRAVQRLVLDAGARRLDVELLVEWTAERRLLRYEVVPAVRARTAWCGIPFGALDRPTVANTTHDRAQFEVPGQGFLDRSQPGRGLALLADGRYGFGLHDDRLAVTLLRAPRFPDPEADRGTHRIRLALLPHGGDPRAAGVPAEAEALAWPLVARAGAARAAPCTIVARGGAQPLVAALKPAEDGDGLVLRLVEMHGGAGPVELRWRDPMVRVEPADLRERPIRDDAVRHDAGAGTTRLDLAPFRIVTLRVRTGATA